jgi:hypothetical protein
MVAPSPMDPQYDKNVGINQIYGGPVKKVSKKKYDGDSKAGSIKPVKHK